MKLLTNNETHRATKLSKEGFICTAYIATAAVHGPYSLKDDEQEDIGFPSYVIGVAIVVAIVAVFFDITIWRP